MFVAACGRVSWRFRREQTVVIDEQTVWISFGFWQALVASGQFWADSGRILGGFWAIRFLGNSGPILGGFWAILGGFWEDSGPILGRFWAILGRFWADLVSGQ